MNAIAIRQGVQVVWGRLLVVCKWNGFKKLKALAEKNRALQRSLSLMGIGKVIGIDFQCLFNAFSV